MSSMFSLLSSTGSQGLCRLSASNLLAECLWLLLQNPSMAAELAQSHRIAGMQTPEQQAKLMQLKDDPELKDMFDDIQKNGAGEILHGPVALAGR